MQRVFEIIYSRLVSSGVFRGNPASEMITDEQMTARRHRRELFSRRVTDVTKVGGGRSRDPSDDVTLAGQWSRLMKRASRLHRRRSCRQRHTTEKLLNTARGSLYALPLLQIFLS